MRNRQVKSNATKKVVHQQSANRPKPSSGKAQRLDADFTGLLDRIKKLPPKIQRIVARHLDATLRDIDAGKMPKIGDYIVDDKRLHESDWLIIHTLRGSPMKSFTPKNIVAKIFLPFAQTAERVKWVAGRLPWLEACGYASKENGRWTAADVGIRTQSSGVKGEPANEK